MYIPVNDSSEIKDKGELVDIGIDGKPVACHTNSL
jgi:hypothetical protein